jgi:hypothetical protein
MLIHLLLMVAFSSCLSPKVTHSTSQKNVVPNAQMTPGVKAKQPPLNIVLNLHMDPWGRRGDSPEELMSQYRKHRDAFLWLCDLARQKGFKITAEITGFYAEYVLRQNHETDFIDFMPGKTHFLGTHLHENYKSDKTPYVWDQSWDSKDAPKIFRDQVLMINRIFKSLGFSETDNHLIHGVVVECDDPATFYGASKTNKAPYPNFFDIVTGYGLLNHPYRTNADALRARLPIEDLDGKFIAIPKPTPGFMGVIHDPYGSPQKVNLTLGTLQKDFILEYIEWQTCNTLDLDPRPWIFAFDIHVLDLNDGLIGGDGKPIRTGFSQFYDWINDHFKGTFRYATASDVAAEYLEWEKAHPNTRTYSDSGRSGEAKPDLLTANIYYRLKGYGPHAYVYHAEHTVDQTRIYEFRKGPHDRSLLIVPKGDASTLDLSAWIHGGGQVIRRTTVDLMEDASRIPLSGEPVLVISER